MRASSAIAAVLFSLLHGGAAPSAQPAALTALNDAFRAAYAEARGRMLAASGPTLLVSGDTFTLIRDGRRVEANVGTPIYGSGQDDRAPAAGNLRDAHARRGRGG